MPTARNDLAAATGHDGRIYAIGGNTTNGTVLNTVEAYTPGSNSWAAVAPMPTARNDLAAATGPDGRIYAIGGWDGENTADVDSYLTTVEAYTPGTNSWATVAPMPTARYFLAAATRPDGRIYAIGGYKNAELTTVEAYTPGTNSWATVAPMPTARYGLAAATGPNGRIYAIGGYHDGSGYVNTVEAYDTGFGTLQDSSVSVSYDSWRGFAVPTANGGTYRATATKGATASFTFSGTGITWVTRKGPASGIASVSIDGVKKGTVDLYAAGAQSFSKGYSRLTSKSHTMVITVTGAKNVASSNTYVTVDAFIVGFTTTQDSSTKVTYDTWKGAVSTSASGGTYRLSPKAGATSSLSFTGTGVDWITATGPSAGKASVTIDGVSKGTVDLYASSVDWQVAETYKGLTSGRHTIVVTVLGTKNASSIDTLIVVDAFVVH
jgi:hypothetical protein